MIIGTPFITYALYYFCTADACPPMTLAQLPMSVREFVFEEAVGDRESFLWYAGWLGSIVGLWAVLPARTVRGQPLRTGGVLEYRENAFTSLVVVAAYYAYQYFTHGHLAFQFIWSHFLGLQTAAFLTSIALSISVYAMSHLQKDALLALGGNTGNAMYDFFIGRLLNPRVGPLDIKSLAELRPGLMLWFLLDVAFMARQYDIYGYVTDSMVLVTVFQGLYVADALFFESTIMTQMDITTDGLGFMLSFGDLVWVPFVYSLQARYLSTHPVHLGPYYTAAIVGLQLFGFYVFRSSNSQKSTFRNNPSHPSVKSKHHF